MDKKEEEFQKRIQETFRIEAEEHLHAISAGLSELEKTQSKKKADEIVEVLFREVHSLKGAARSVDQKDVEYVCQPLESIFSALKRQEIGLTPVSIDLFYKTVEWLSKYVATSGVGQTALFQNTRMELTRQLKEMASGEVFANELLQTSLTDSEKSLTFHHDPVPKTEPETDIQSNILPVQVGMVRIAISKLDPLLMQAEEMIQSKIAIDQRTNELKDFYSELIDWKNEEQKWRNRRISATLDIWNEWCDNSEMQLNKLESRMLEILRLMERNQHTLDLLVDNHLEAMKKVLMLPVSYIVETFPGMVREISREQKKEIDFIIIGAELEIDKRILEELKDPLIHLIRNSIDHGIGKPQDRILQNKPARGTITLAFVPKESGQVEITLSDDGKGIDSDKCAESSRKIRNPLR